MLKCSYPFTASNGSSLRLILLGLNSINLAEKCVEHQRVHGDYEKQGQGIAEHEERKLKIFSCKLLKFIIEDPPGRQHKWTFCAQIRTETVKKYLEIHLHSKVESSSLDN